MFYLRTVVDYIDSLETGDNFRRYFAFGLKFSGVLTLIVTILLGFALLYFVRETPTLITGAVLSTIIITHFGITVVLLYWNRANKITALGRDSHLTFAPIVSILGRLSGEVFCLFFITLGIFFLVSSIFMPSVFGYMPYGLPASYEFFIFLVSGLLLFFLCVLIAIFFLIFFYIMAEYAGLIGDIATNTKQIETMLSTMVTNSEDTETASSAEDG